MGNKLDEFKQTKPLVGCFWIIVGCAICAVIFTIVTM